MKAVLIATWLGASALAQGMFDLPTGTWEGKTDQGKRFSLHTETSADHAFRLEYGTSVVVTGNYRVTATKGQPHVSFTPKTITQNGKILSALTVEGWPLKVGQDSRSILDYQDRNVSLDTFGPEGEYFWRLKLAETAP